MEQYHRGECFLTTVVFHGGSREARVGGARRRVKLSSWEHPTQPFIMDSPFTSPRGPPRWAPRQNAATPGKLPSPNERIRRETLAPPRSPAFSSLTYGPCLSRRTLRRKRSGTFIGQCRSPFGQVRSPHTVGVRETTRITSPRERSRQRPDHARCFSTARSLALLPQPKRDPSRPVPAWPLRQPALLRDRWLLTQSREQTGSDRDF